MPDEMRHGFLRLTKWNCAAGYIRPWIFIYFASMMFFLYRCGVRIYFALLWVASFFNSKASLFFSGRKNLFENLKRHLPEKNSPLVWFHAASLGEFEQGRPVIEALKRARPDIRVLLTFFSPSGYEVRKGYSVADYVSYLPVESVANIRRFYDIANPAMAIFIKYEFWKGFIEEAKRRNIKLLSISAIFRPNQLFFKSYGGFFLKTLEQFDHLFVQNSISSHLLRSAGIQQVTIAGDTRFDRVKEIRSQAQKIAIAQAFKAGELLIVMGSVWPQDMEMIYPAIKKLSPKVRFIVAPHQIENGFLIEIEEKSGVPSVRYSAAEAETVANFRLLLIDNIGMLSSLYGYGDIAFVGGGFRGGLHNTLEPAVFGVPVVWGHHEKNDKFDEVQGLTAFGGGIPAKSQEDLTLIFSQLTGDEQLRLETGSKAASFVGQNTGATSKIMEYLIAKLEG